MRNVLTHRRVMEKKLEALGVLPSQSKLIVQTFIKDVEKLEVQIPWNWDTNNLYPDEVYNALNPQLWRTADKWVTRHAPKAWFKPIFKQMLGE